VRGKLVVLLALVALPALLTAGPATADSKPKRKQPAHVKHRPKPKPEHRGLVTLWPITYRAHDGKPRRAFVSLPSWYGPRHDPPLPLVISPHGRGVSAHANARLWGGLPARGGFAVISPDGAGRKLDNYSWGSLGQIEDLSRMPQIARLTVPWLRIDTRRVYAVGGSMGGQETLLLLARYPRLLAGAAAFDSVTDLARQYRSFPRIPCKHGCRSWDGNLGRELQSLAREEIGGTPKTRPLAYAVRSPITYARSIAASCVPLQLWWSLSDRIVADQQQQSGALFRRIRELNPHDPVSSFVGSWAHSAEMKSSSRLPLALEQLGLLASDQSKLTWGLHFTPPPDPASCRR
jgi:pimeloyl-ACP methyl ester carboxylesterase